MLAAFHGSVYPVRGQTLQGLHPVDIDDHGLTTPKKALVVNVCNEGIKASVNPYNATTCIGKKLVVNRLKIENVVETNADSS